MSAEVLILHEIVKLEREEKEAVKEERAKEIGHRFRRDFGISGNPGFQKGQWGKWRPSSGKEQRFAG